MMEAYGSYETSREITSGRGSVLFAAVKKGESGGQFVVKVVLPAPSSTDLFADAPSSDPEAGEAFLSSVEIQKKAAASSQHIAPILEAGSDQRGSWAVTPLYPRSVQKIIAGRVALNQDGLYHVIQSIVAGLREMKQACGRSHGRLHAGNVLIGGGATLGEAHVHLTDCAPVGIEAARCELADLRSVGLILYQLVRKREVGEDDDWLILPLEASKEWTEIFGTSTGAWLAIGNALLDRKLSLESYSLENLSQDLAALQPKPAVSRRTLALVGALVGLAVVGLVFFLWSGSWGTIHISIVGPGGMNGPGDARVTVDGQLVKSKPPTGTRRQFKLRKNQRYEFAVSYGDLVPFKTNVMVDGKSGQSLELPLVFGNLVVEGLTPGAEFALTNGATGNTGNTTRNYTNAFAKPGLWQLTLKREGFVSALLETNLQAGQSSVLRALLKARDPGKVLVELTSTPRGAEVLFIDAVGNIVETNNGTAISQIPPGRYKLSATYPFWDRPQIRTNPLFEVLAGQDTSTNFSFPNSRISIVCEDPPGATVTVSNRFGTGLPRTNFVVAAPSSPPPWPTGTFVFHFEAPGYVSSNITVNVLDGVSTLVKTRLAPKQGFASLVTDLPALITNSVTGECIATNLANIANVIALKPGSNYTLRATPQGYPGIPEKTLSITNLTRGEIRTVEFKFDFGRVALSSYPEGADVDDPLTRKAVPITLLSVLPLGTTTLNARHPKYGFAEETLMVTNLTRGEIRQLPFRFKYGTVIVTSQPPNLMVRGTNGQVLGQTPYTNYFVPFGQATYQLFNTNQRTRKLEVAVAEWTNYFRGHNFEIPDGYTNSFGMEFEFVPAANLYVACFELTEEVYAKVMKTNRGFANDFPARAVSFSEARRFMEELNKIEGGILKTPLPDGEIYEYAIPRVAEWQMYAPTNTITDDVNAILRKDNVVTEPGSVHRPRTPGTNLRIFDLYGNVAEWTEGDDGSAYYCGGFYNTSVKSMFYTEGPLKNASIWPRISPEGKAQFSVGLRCVLRRKK